MQKENGDNLVQMFNVLSRKGADIASKASKRKRTYDYLVDELDKLEKNIDLMIQQEDQTQFSQHQGSGIEIANAEQQEQEKDVQEEHIEDPDTANTKGRKPKRYRRIVEKIIESSKKKIEEQEDAEENQNKARPKRKNNEEKQTANSATKGNAEN